MSEERLMKTPEEVRQKAIELLQMPKEELLTKYMFQEQEIERLNNIINELEKELEDMATLKIDKYGNTRKITHIDINWLLTKIKELKGVDKE